MEEVDWLGHWLSAIEGHAGSLNIIIMHPCT
jgi:hypothetical protein